MSCRTRILSPPLHSFGSVSLAAAASGERARMVVVGGERSKTSWRVRLRLSLKTVPADWHARFLSRLPTQVVFVPLRQRLRLCRHRTCGRRLPLTLSDSPVVCRPSDKACAATFSCLCLHPQHTHTHGRAARPPSIVISGNFKRCEPADRESKKKKDGTWVVMVVLGRGEHPAHKHTRMVPLFHVGSIFVSVGADAAIDAFSSCACAALWCLLHILASVRCRGRREGWRGERGGGRTSRTCASQCSTTYACAPALRPAYGDTCTHGPASLPR